MRYRRNTGQNGTIVNAASGTLLHTRVHVMPICGTAARETFGADVSRMRTSGHTNEMGD